MSGAEKYLRDAFIARGLDGNGLTVPANRAVREITRLANEAAVAGDAVLADFLVGAGAAYGALVTEQGDALLGRDGEQLSAETERFLADGSDDA